MHDQSVDVPMEGVGATLLQKTSDAVLVVHVDSGRVVMCNPAAEALLGYTAGEAVGMHVDDFVPEDIRPYHVFGFKRFQDTDEAETLNATEPSKLIMLMKSGERVNVYGVLARAEGSTDRFLVSLFRPRED